MKKIIYLSLLVLCSCSIQYDAETRLLFETIVVDSNDNPLKDINLEVYVSSGSGLGSSSETISLGKTDENGKIRLVFPSPKFENGYKVFINSPYNENLGFLDVRIGNLKLNDFENYKLSIPKIYRLTFEESAGVNLTFNNFPPSNKKFVDLKINGIYTSTNSNINEEETYYQTSFYAKKNQTISIEYRIENSTTGIVDTYSQNLNIGEDFFETTINY